MAAKKNIRSGTVTGTRRAAVSAGDVGEAPAGDSPADDGLKLREFCRRTGATERDVLYALSLGLISVPGNSRPGSGYHRRFTPLEALGLALALELKKTGLTMPQAVRIGDWLVQTHPRSPRADAASWWGADWRQLPHRHLSLEVAYAVWVRLALDLPVNPVETHDVQPWTSVSDGSRPPLFQPITVLRTSVSQLAARLQNTGATDTATQRG